MKVLVTGAAGFIGFATCQRLLARGEEVVGLDNLNDYYDVALKQSRLERLHAADGCFRFVRLDLADHQGMLELFRSERFVRVVHLGAQVGVRYSTQDPRRYADANISGTLNVLEGCRHGGVEHLVYASSSSVYGANRELPFSERQAAVHPLSLYAASKRAAELMAHSYSAAFGLPTTGLRLFTVYGPWARPDMALSMFARAILEGRPIEVFNQGQHTRDFTYIDDIVEGIIRILDTVATPNPHWDGTNPDPASSPAPFRLYNLGNNRPIELARYIAVLEECLHRKAQVVYLPLQTGDLPDTFADITALRAHVGFSPETPVEVGVSRFADWFCSHYGYTR